VDNITHSLVGIALADLAMGRRATKAQRPLLVGAGIIAANLPDLDFAYSRITPPPIGYLLHHRGHTHTVVGLVVLTLILGLAYRFLPSVRKMRPSGQLRFWLLIAIALASHLLLDSFNSYGVHPFYPFDNTWYFGDSLFILEPSLWLILGVAAAWNGRTRAARLAVVLPMAILLCTIASTGEIPLESLAVLAIGGVLFAWGTFDLSHASGGGPRGVRAHRRRLYWHVAPRSPCRRGCVNTQAPRPDCRCHPDAEWIVAAVLGSDCDRVARGRWRVRALEGHIVSDANVEGADRLRLSSVPGPARRADHRQWPTGAAR
jgi:membrane-bound metal-dependent hydrolase YbcI (DUF457 family)